MAEQKQILSGLHLNGNGLPVSGRVVKATPVSGQYTFDSTVDSRSVTSQINAITGEWEIELLQGIIYEVKITGWGIVSLTVSYDEARNFSDYFDGNGVISGNRVAGYIRTPSGDNLMPVTTLDEEGNKVITWELVDSDIPAPSTVVSVSVSNKNVTVLCDENMTPLEGALEGILTQINYYEGATPIPYAVSLQSAVGSCFAYIDHSVVNGGITAGVERFPRFSNYAIFENPSEMTENTAQIAYSFVVRASKGTSNHTVFQTFTKVRA